MLRHPRCGGPVVDLDLRNVGARDRLAERDERDRDPGGLPLPFAALAEQVAVEENGAVHAPRRGEGREMRLLLGRAVEIADDHAVAGLEERFLDAAQDLGKERVREIRQDHQHHAGLLRAQGARSGVRHIARLGDGLQHPRPRFGRDPLRRGESTADGSGRDLGELRDILNAGGAERNALLLRSVSLPGLVHGSPPTMVLFDRSRRFGKVSCNRLHGPSSQVSRAFKAQRSRKRTGRKQEETNASSRLFQLNVTGTVSPADRLRPSGRERCRSSGAVHGIRSSRREHLEILRADRGPERDFARPEARRGACGHRRERRRQVDPDAHPLGPSPADEGQSSSRTASRSRFSGPVEAESQGIVLVHQEILLAADLTVAQNLFLGREIRRFGFVDDAAMRERARAILRRARHRHRPGPAGAPPLHRRPAARADRPRAARAAQGRRLRRADGRSHARSRPRACSRSSAGCAPRASPSSTSPIA